MPAAAAVGAIASIAGGVAVGASTIAGGLMIAGGVASLAGQLTGNKTLATIGGVASLVGGGMSAFGIGTGGSGGLVSGGASPASSALTSASGMERLGGLGSGITLGGGESLASMGGGLGLTAPSVGGAINDVVGGFANAGASFGGSGLSAPNIDAMGGGGGLQAPSSGGAINDTVSGLSNAAPIPTQAQSGGIQSRFDDPGFIPGGIESPVPAPTVEPPGKMLDMGMDQSSSLMSSPEYTGPKTAGQGMKSEPFGKGLLRTSEVSEPGLSAPGAAPSPFSDASALGKGITVAGDGKVNFGGQTVLDPKTDVSRGFGAIKDKLGKLGQVVRDNKELFYIASSAFQKAYQGQRMPTEASAALEDLRRAQAENYREATATSREQRENANNVTGLRINLTPTGASPFGPGTMPMPGRPVPGLLRTR